MGKSTKGKKILKKADILKFISVILCLVMLIFSCIFLRNAPKIVLIVVFLAFAAFGVVIPGIDATKHEPMLKAFFVALVSVILVLIIYIVLQATGIMSRMKDIEQMIALIRSTGNAGIVVFILIVLLNVVFLPIPPAVPAVIGTILYGPFWSFVYMSVGTVAGSIITFALGRLFGKKVVIWMIGKEKTEKYAQLMVEKGRPAFVFMIIFPFFPDDVLCLIAGMTHMSYGYFIGVICTTRTAVLAFMCFFSDGSIIPFSGWGIPVWIAIGVFLIGAFILVTIFKKRLMEKKSGQEKLLLQQEYPQKSNQRLLNKKQKRVKKITP